MQQATTQVVPDIATFKVSVDNRLRQILGQASARGVAIDPLQGEVIDRVSTELLRGGKRLRPILVYLAHIGSGGVESASLLDAACAMELIHHFLLIHDDVFDRDLIRHGGPNVLSAYVSKFSATASPAEAFHYGSAFAVMAGNVVSVMAHQTLLETQFEDDRKLAALLALEHMLFDIMAGELLDVAVAIPGAPEAPESTLLKIARYKTASYSFEAPLNIGSILAGGSRSVRQQLIAFGKSLGIAYQLTDDLLGLYGDEHKIGKPVTSDLTEGKQTLLIHYAMHLLAPRQANRLRTLWGNKQAAQPELDEVRILIDESGAKAKVERLAHDYEAAARLTLANIKIAPQVRQQLEALSSACVDRTS